MKNPIPPSNTSHRSLGRFSSPGTLGPLLTAGAALLLCQIAASAEPPGYTFTPITYLGDPAPGGGVTFVNDFEPSHLNNRGEVAFTADLDSSGSIGEGIFLRSKDGLRRIMRFGDPAPGGGIFSTYELGLIGLNDEGDLAFGMTLEPLNLVQPPYGGTYRYSHLTETLTPVAIPGMPAPDGGTFVGSSGYSTINNQGSIAFYGWVDTLVAAFGPDSAAVFLADNQNRLTTIASRTKGGFGWVGVPWINNQRDIAFAGWKPAGPGSAFHDCIFLKKASHDAITTLVQPGDVSDQGDVILRAFYPKLNDAGEVAFLGVLAFGDDVSDFLSYVSGVFLYSHGVLHRVAVPGDPMPGGGHLSFLATVDWQVGFNNRGDVAFWAVLDNGEEGLYLYSKGSISLIAKTGTVIPGVGTVFDLEMQGFIPGFPVPPSGFPTCGSQLNDHGQTAFGCTLTDGRVVLLLATLR